MRVVSKIVSGTPVFIGSFTPTPEQQKAGIFSVDIPEGSSVQPDFPDMPGRCWLSATHLAGRTINERVVMASVEKAALLPGWTALPAADGQP